MRSMLSFAIVVLFMSSALAADKHKPPAGNADLKPVTVDELTWSGDLAAPSNRQPRKRKPFSSTLPASHAPIAKSTRRRFS